MMTRSLKLVVALLAALSAANLANAQAPGAKPPDWANKLSTLLKEKNFDEATSLVRAKAAELPPAAEAPRAMFGVAQALYWEKEYDESLALNTEITEQFPKSPAAALAWCGMGQVHAKRGETDKMIAALERGMAAGPAWTEMNDMNAREIHGYACQVLGAHYQKDRQWDKALKVYTQWKPNSWCGTCHASMVAARTKNILLCLIHLGKFNDATREAWHSFVDAGFLQSSELEAFVLVRLYAEAGQLDHLRQLAQQMMESSEEDTTHIPHDLSVRIERLKTSISLAESKRFSDHIAVFQETGDRSQMHIAAWVLIRHHPRTMQSLLKAARDDSAAGYLLTQVVAAVDSPSADSALNSLLRNAKPARRELVESLKRERAALAKDKRLGAKVSREEGSLPWPFYAQWPSPDEGSLPKELPPDLFAEGK